MRLSFPIILVLKPFLDAIDPTEGPLTMLARRIQIAVSFGAIAVAAMVWAPRESEGADHRDSPRLMANTATLGNVDINDVYLFQSPTVADRTVIILTLSPAAGVIGPATFAPGAVYEIRVQNTAALADNFALQFMFSQPDAFGRQNYQLVKQSAKGQPLVSIATGIAPASVIQNELLAFGTTGQALAVKGGGRVTAGLFDDPFFFDLNAFNKFVGLAESGASLAQRVAPFFPPNVPSNFFGTFNVIAMVLELPTETLTSPGHTKLGLWGRTVLNGQQIDRMGRPAINTATIPSGFKEAFNVLTPFTDQADFTVAMTNDIAALYGVSQAYAMTLAQTLLPDLLTIDTALVPSRFLNGRFLTDDVIDAEFKLLTNGALVTDRVNFDSVCSIYFPYLGVAHPIGH